MICSLPLQCIASCRSPCASRRMLPQAAAKCILMLQDVMDLVALLPFQKMLQLALEPLLIGPSEVTGQKRPTACQPDAQDADSHLVWGSHDGRTTLLGAFTPELSSRVGLSCMKGCRLAEHRTVVSSKHCTCWSVTSAVGSALAEFSTLSWPYTR